MITGDVDIYIIKFPHLAVSLSLRYIHFHIWILVSHYADTPIYIFPPALVLSAISYIREAQNCLQRTKWLAGFLFWYKKTVMQKKKVFAARNLKRLDQVYHSKQWKGKKKINFFITTFLWFATYIECVEKDQCCELQSAASWRKHSFDLSRWRVPLRIWSTVLSIIVHSKNH